MQPNPNERNPASGPGFEGQHATGQAQANGNASRTSALSQPDFNDAQNFLDLIGPTASRFNFRTFNDAKDSPADGHKFHGTLASVATALENDNTGRRGVFVVINAGGDTDDSITSIRAVFADTDGALLDPIMSCGLDVSCLGIGDGINRRPKGAEAGASRSRWKTCRSAWSVTTARNARACTACRCA